MSITPTPNIDYTNKDYEAFRAYMIKQLGIKMPEYTDRSQTDAGIVILELLAKGLDILSFHQDVQANEAFLITEEQRANALKWCYVLDYIPRSSIPSKVKQVFVLASPQTSSTYIPAGTRVKTVESATEYSVMFETETDLEIPAGMLGDETDEKGNYLYAVTAVQGLTIQSEIVGSSNGTEDQRFTLGYTPVISSSIAVLVNEGAGFEPWVRVESFLDSTPTDKHYKVEMTDNDEAVIVFGNDITGKIPTAFSNGIVVTYRIGGGSQGNVGANKIIQLDTNVAKVDSTFNPDVPFELGYDKETLAEIKTNAPNSYRTKWACLTEEDYADRVRELFPQIALSSSQKNKELVDTVNVYVLLHNNAELSDSLREEIMQMYEDRELVGTQVNLVPANSSTFVPLDLSMSIIVKDRYTQKSVKDEITAMFTSYFKIGDYDFGKECSVTDLEAMVKENCDGVKSIRMSATSSISQEGDMVIYPAVSQILTLGTLNFEMTGGIADE